MEDFSSTVEEVGLADLGFEGCPFTWSNNRLAPRMVRCRLDRMYVNGVAMTCFPTFLDQVEHPRSDHIPILLHFVRDSFCSRIVH